MGSIWTEELLLFKPFAWGCNSIILIYFIYTSFIYLFVGILQHSAPQYYVVQH